LRADGRLDPDHEMYPTDQGALDAPTAVRDAVERRIEGLDDDGRAVLRTAAVVGRTVPLSVLSSVVDLDRQTVLDYADLLAGTDVWDVDRDAGTVTFRSGLVRSVVEDTVDDDRAATLHREAAAALRDRSDAAGDQADVARHYDLAGEDDLALEFYVRAGDRARQVYAHEVAIDSYERALSLTREDEERVRDLLRTLGETYQLVGEYEDARKTFRFVRERTDDPAFAARMDERRAAALVEQGDFEAAVDLAEAAIERAPDDDRLVAELHNRLGWGVRELGDYERARDAFETAREVAEGLGDGEVLAEAHHNLGGVGLYVGDLDTAEDHLQRAVELHDDLDDPKGLSGTHNNLGVVASFRGDLEAAQRHYEAALAIDREIGDLWSLALSLNNLGNVYKNLGDLDRALACYEESIETARKTDDTYALASAIGNVGNLCRATGDLDAARERHERRLSLEDDIGRERGVGIVYKNLGHVEREAGDLDAAVDHYERSLERFEAIGEGRHVAGSSFGLALALLRRDGPADARPHVERALETACEADDAQMLARASRAAARLARTTGEYAAAADHLDAAADALDDTGNRFQRPKIRFERGLLARARGDEAEGRALLESARDTFADRGMERWVEWCEQALDGCECPHGDG
jgi:tetratricopeptide (TPR) repeat protein